MDVLIAQVQRAPELRELHVKPAWLCVRVSIRFDIGVPGIHKSERAAFIIILVFLFWENNPEIAPRFWRIIMVPATGNKNCQEYQYQKIFQGCSCFEVHISHDFSACKTNIS